MKQRKDETSPMPFGLLWCCYTKQRRNTRRARNVTNAFRPFVVLLLHEIQYMDPAVRVTNAFRPFVVLLRGD